MKTNKKARKSAPRVVAARYQRVELDRTFDQISEHEILEAQTRTTDTTNASLGVIRKLKLFLRVADDAEILEM